MSIHDELVDELKAAMRAQDRLRLDVIRQIETEAARARAEKGFSGDPKGDELYAAVIASYSKKMEKARDPQHHPEPCAQKTVFYFPARRLPPTADK